MKLNITTLAVFGGILGILGSSAVAKDPMDPGDTGLPQDVIDRKARYYLKWDADGNQQLSPDEFEEMVRTQFDNQGKSGHKEAAGKRFTRRDLDKDGYVSFEEQLMTPEQIDARLKGMKASTQAKPEVNPEVRTEVEKKAAYFLKWDTDNDRQLNREEYTEMVRAQFEKNGRTGYKEAAVKRFDNKDANGDGQVTFKEHMR